jgi:putative endonuclease
MSGIVSFHAGRVAEDSVALAYAKAGLEIIARRWRTAAGEIDLVARSGAEIVFIEVKKSKTHAMAAEHLSARQIGRICRAASEFIGSEPAGQDTPMRFDVALVDAVGRIEILQNAFAA